MRCILYCWFFMGFTLVTYTMWSDVSEQEELILLAYVTNQCTSGTGPREIDMLHLLGIVVGLLFIIMCFSKGLKDEMKPQKLQLPESSASNKKKDLSEEDLHLLARILSVGLVDADPNYLHHLKGYRDLRGA